MSNQCGDDSYDQQLEYDLQVYSLKLAAEAAAVRMLRAETLYRYYMYRRELEMFRSELAKLGHVL